MNVLDYYLDYPPFIQEIKFEPNVMCEHIDKKLTFQGSQVRIPNVAL